MSELFKVFINCSRLRNSGTHSFSPMFPHSLLRSPHEFLLISLVPLGSPMHVNPWTVLLMLDSRILGWQACLCRPSGLSWSGVSSDKLVFDSLPVFLTLVLSVQGSFLQIVVGRPCLFLTCHWFLAVFCRAKTSCARILVSQMFFQHLVTGGVHLPFV